MVVPACWALGWLSIRTFHRRAFFVARSTARLLMMDGDQ